MQWSTFEVDEVMVHYVESSRDAARPQLMLTSEAIELDEDLTGYFADKVADRLEVKGLQVVRDRDQDQTTADALAAILADEDELVARSRDVAQRLFDVQSKSNSSGLLAVLSGTVSSKRTRCVAVIKLERQRGVSFEIDVASGTVDLELMRNLTLTDKTKVYKTAVFVERGQSRRLEGWVADDQRSSQKGHQVASFFLGRFLGCKPKQPAAEITYRFVKTANASFNAVVDSPETRGRYQVALLSMMQDNTTDVRPATFATKHLDKEHRQPFLDAMEKADIPPKETFAKDTSRVWVNDFKMTFASGMVLVGPSRALEENVDIPKTPSAQDPVRLKDSVGSILAGR